MLEDLAASQLPQALADLARLHPGATLEVLSLSGDARREAYDAGRVQLVLAHPRPYRRLYAVTKADAGLTPLADMLVDLLRDVARDITATWEAPGRGL